MRKILLKALLLAQVPLLGFGQGSAIFGTTQVHPGGHYGVYGPVNFISGYLITPRNLPTDNIFFTAGSSYLTATDASHVDGYAEKAGTTAFTFPIGNGTKLRTAGISAPASGTFKAAYWSQNPATATLPAGAPFPTTQMGAGVTAVSTVEYWDIDGPSAVSVTLSWDAASNVTTLTGNTINRLVVLGYNTATSNWENLGSAGGVTGSLATTGTVTATDIIPDNYLAFTLGSFVDAPDLTPILVMSQPNFSSVNPTRPFQLEIYNIPAPSSSGLITVYMIKPTPNFTMSFSGSGWTAVDSGAFYTLTTSAVVPGSAAAAVSISGSITRGSGVAKGVYNLQAVIADGSGSEQENTNNTANVTLNVNP